MNFFPLHSHEKSGEDNSRPKIYDCFIFFNELELLNLRFHELYDVVDYFVIVESKETHKGNLKPYYFEENKERFTPFLDKVIHVKVENRLAASAGPWDRENYQRDQIMRGLINCKDSDIVVISDLDEIYRNTVMPELVSLLHSAEEPSYIVCSEMMYYFFLNRPVIWWTAGSTATLFQWLKNSSPQKLRERKSVGTYHTIPNAGWHFSGLGGVDAYIEKINAYPHNFDDVRENFKWLIGKDLGKITPDKIRYVIELGPFIPIDDSFPQYVIDNQEYYRKIGFLHDVR